MAEWEPPRSPSAFPLEEGATASAPPDQGQGRRRQQGVGRADRHRRRSVEEGENRVVVVHQPFRLVEVGRVIQPQARLQRLVGKAVGTEVGCRC